MKHAHYVKAIALALAFSVPRMLAAQPGGQTPDPGMISGTGSNYGINNIYSANYFTGTLNVSVPVYSLNVAGGEYGVRLTYNTKGVLVDEIDNPEGLHWQLVTGGSIERIVKDIPDEINIDSNPETIYNYVTPFANPHKKVRGKLARYYESAAERSETNVYRDGECDEFIVSLFGSSFTFYIGEDMRIFTHPKKNISVRMLVNGVPQFDFVQKNVGMNTYDKLITFEIRDERGNVFTFEPSAFDLRTYMDNTLWDQMHVVESTAITKWVIKEVVFADGNKIRYTYDKSWVNAPGGPDYYPKYHRYAVRERNNSVAEFAGQTTVTQAAYFSQITEIAYPNGNNVAFIYDPDARTLDRRKLLKQVVVKSASTPANCVRYKLFHTQNNERWYLDSMKIASCDDTYTEPYYSFRYHDIKLPKRFNFGQDLFGYFNADSVSTQVQGYPVNIAKHHFQGGTIANYGVGKMYLPFYAQASLLTHVRNAYGGEVRFKYKNNTYDVLSPYQIPGGSGNENYLGTGNLGIDGVAIDSIIEFDKFHPNDTRVTKFDYHNSGMLFIPGGYVHYPEYVDSSTNAWRDIIYQTLFLSKHQFVAGSNHGYSAVGVLTYNASGSLLSRTEYKFSNIADALSSGRFHWNGKEAWQFPYANKQYLKDWELGLPLEVTKYDNNNRIIGSQVNVYEFSDVDTSAAAYVTNRKTSKVNSGSRVVIDISSTPYYPYKKIFTDDYYPFTGRSYLKKIISRKYVSDTRSVADTVEFAYDFKNNVVAAITTDSKGAKFLTRYVYNYAVDGPESPYGTSTLGSPLFALSSAGIQQMVGTERWKLNGPYLEPPYNHELLEASISTYSFDNGKIWPVKTFSTRIGNPVNYTSYTGVASGNPNSNPYARILEAYSAPNTNVAFHKKTEEITRYDIKGNVLEVLHTEGRKYNAAVYDTATNDLIAEAANANWTDIACTSFENLPALQGWITTGNLDLNATKIVNTSGNNALTAVTGNYVYALTPPPTSGFNFSDINGTGLLTPGKEYILSFWCLNGVPQVFVGTVALAAPAAPAYERNGWQNYIFRFTPAQPSKIRIAPVATQTISLDEVRLHPAASLMTSYTYTPLYGVSSVTDQTGRITYYEYDKLGRRNLIRDQERFIVEKTKNQVNGGY